MRAIRTHLVGLAIGAMIVFAAVAAAQVLTRPASVDRAAPTFRVTGSVTGLYPGVRTVLRARVVNRFDHPIRVRRVTARVRSTVQDCPTSSVRIRPWRGNLLLRPHAVKRVRLRIRMTPAAPNGCQGVRFRIRYGGKAVRP